jgi:ABC-type transport system involved in cytochrome c biogenesis permease subunit
MSEASDSQFRAVRIMHRIMLVSVVLYAIAAETSAKPSSHLPARMVLGLTLVASAVAIVALGFHMKTLPSAVESMRRNQQDSRALFRWRQAHITTMVLLQSVALFGFVLQFMGGSFWIALPFYSASVLLLLLLAPRKIADAIDGPDSRSQEK